MGGTAEFGWGPDGPRGRETPWLVYYLNIEMTSKHIYSSDPKDHIISGVVRSSRMQPKVHEIQSEVVDVLNPHLRESFGEQSLRVKSVPKIRF